MTLNAIAFFPKVLQLIKLNYFFLKVEPAIEVYHDAEYISKRWHFPYYNFTISVIWSSFLTKAAIFENYDGVSTSEIELHLDKLDSTWTDLYEGLDYMIFARGKWFIKTAIYYENDIILGCHYCPKRKLPVLGFNFCLPQSPEELVQLHHHIQSQRNDFLSDDHSEPLRERGMVQWRNLP
ncbi:hypothetical protein ACSBR1_022584 [Camellia fascicularis]